MTEKPIIFSTKMVQAILSGRKTQTRRVMKVQPSTQDHKFLTVLDTTARNARLIRGKHHWAKLTADSCRLLDSSVYFSSPYGYVEERLWVRESFALSNNKCFYKANFEDEDITTWKPAIHLPRSFSRITLEITKLRIQRLNDITEEEAIAEGCTGLHLQRLDKPQQFLPPVEHFAHVWDKINSKRGFSWATNPYVWVIEFRRVEV